MKRREFLRGAATLGGAAMLGSPLSRVLAADGVPRLRGGSMLDLPASQAPVDTIVVLMMENRSFDHYLGWLRTDRAYREESRRRYRRFRVRADNTRRYRDANGTLVATYHLPAQPGEANPYRGCNHPDPGHGWTAGRIQRDSGFLAPGSGNDEYALGYYLADDLPFYTALTRRFTVCDRYHCSILGPTFPNREYLHSAQSGGIKNNAFPTQVGYPSGFTWDTIWDRLIAAGVPVGYYCVDLPVTALWGSRLLAITHTAADYFADAAAGTLPNVVFLDPGFLGDLRTDEHPHGDVRDGQSLVYNYVKAFVESPHWESGVLILTYDEWGGFFDHVRPPVLPDDRASDDDQENFGQAGFRVPTRLISPYARPSFVDHRLYDHTSILRFIEWRFLGAPPHGPGGLYDTWYLTLRDRTANNIGWSLMPGTPEPEFDTSAPTEPPTTHSPPCGQALIAPAVRSGSVEMHPLEQGLHDGYFERMGYRVDVKPLPFALRGGS
jgi:phospholipase C